MQKNLLLLLGGTLGLLGLFAMPMKRVNPRQNLVDNPFGWGLFGFGLAVLMIGLSKPGRTEKHIEARPEETAHHGDAFKIETDKTKEKDKEKEQVVQ